MKSVGVWEGSEEEKDQERMEKQINNKATDWEKERIRGERDWAYSFIFFLFFLLLASDPEIDRGWRTFFKDIATR